MNLPGLKNYVERLSDLQNVVLTVPALAEMQHFLDECDALFKGGANAVVEIYVSHSPVGPLVLKSLVNSFLGSRVAQIKSYEKVIIQPAFGKYLDGAARLLMLPSYRFLEWLIQYGQVKNSDDLVTTWCSKIVGISANELKDESNDTCGCIAIENMKNLFAFLAKSLWLPKRRGMKEAQVTELYNASLCRHIQKATNIRVYNHRGKRSIDYASLLRSGFTLEDLLKHKDLKDPYIAKSIYHRLKKLHLLKGDSK